MLIVLLFSCLAGVCLGLEVRQSPSEVFAKPGDTLQIICSHDKTDYRQMLWYQRSPGGDTAMKLVGYLYFKDVTMEAPYDKDFNISGDLGGNTAKKGSLLMKSVGRGHSAVYYCAASEAR
ncbi:Hypothetical protein SMAX5B_003331 [Scophthalmus maximus]|uniref:Ig-like domain-containing protein n=1 Tax=Scophthalmus maximus TaxID=52904 RepID=A0A2U9CGZ8_SCOMX|nr:Hypothetical protein SMAX5B_003331 [Scophthalmus maximus]